MTAGPDTHPPAPAALPDAAPFPAAAPGAAPAAAPPAAWSLERRQWLGMGLLTLVGLVLVSLGVYGLTASHLAQRRQESLQAMSRLVVHLLTERAASHDPHTLGMQLDDHFSGHADLSLRILGPDGTVRYHTPHEMAATEADTLAFRIAPEVPAFGGLQARLSLDTTPDRQLLQHLAWTLAVSSLLGAGLLALGGLLLIRRGIRPVADLSRQIRQLGTSDLGLRLDDSLQPRELRPLVADFNALLDRIERAHTQLEGFNADVAHELNTPLATLRASHEVALRRYRDDPALLDLFGSNLEELQRMAGMVRDMLFLAQVDHGALARRSPVPSLRALIASVVDYHDALLDEAGLTVEVEGDGSGALDAPLLQRALSNLLGNACRYADRGSTIRIAVGHPAPGRLSLAVANRGPGIDAARLARIFDRFYRADDPARSHARHHHGLGLSIVAAVARMHGGTVHATSAPHGTCITMELILEPAACTGPCAGADNAGIRPPPAPASPIPEPSAARTGNRYGENDLHEP